MSAWIVGFDCRHHNISKVSKLTFSWPNLIEMYKHYVLRHQKATASVSGELAARNSRYTNQHKNSRIRPATETAVLAAFLGGFFTN